MRLEYNDWVKIAKMLDAGMKHTDVAAISGLSTTVVGKTSAMLGAVRKKDVEQMASISRTYNSQNLAKMACQYCGVNSLFYEMVDAMKNYEMVDAMKNEVTEQATTPTTPDNTALMWASMLEAIKEQSKAVETLTATVKGMQLTLQGFRGDFSEKAKGIVEAINLNADYLNKDIEKAVDHLGGIKQNTKKGGYHQP